MVADDVCEFLSVAFSRVSPKLFAAGNASGSVYIWDVCRPDDPFASLPHIHAEEVISIYFDHRSDHRLLSASLTVESRYMTSAYHSVSVRLVALVLALGLDLISLSQLTYQYRVSF